jgi:two-component system response regulator AtoC
MLVPYFLSFFQCANLTLFMWCTQKPEQPESGQAYGMTASGNPRRILVGEDDLEVLGYFEVALKTVGYLVEAAHDGAEVLSCLRSSRLPIDAILLDIVMPNRDGLATLLEIRDFDPGMPVIAVSGAASPQSIVIAMKNGATDFLCKPVDHQHLYRVLSSAIETRELSSRPSRSPKPTDSSFIGASPPMRDIRRRLGQIGWSDVPVLIQGETGTGKEVLARELHAQSPRADNPFLKLNCAALPSELIESELFGHERGAFTGAIQKKPGMFETADSGTILLDEIGDMDLRLQAKLLHVLQDQEFRRIGGRETIKVDVRVIAATHRDLEKAILDRAFREDLYYRLCVISLNVPPLRDRNDDVIPLAEFFIQKYATKGMPCPRLTADLKDALIAYRWPGNVRELENYIRRLTVLRDGELIARELYVKINRKSHIPISPEGFEGAHTVAVADSPLEHVGKAKEQGERAAILEALNSTRWNRRQAAAVLKIEYKALLYRMKRLGLDARTQP